MSSESNMARRVIKALRPLHAIRVEDSIRKGVPDVNYVEGWLELKVKEDWPKKENTVVKLSHLTWDQRAFGLERYHKGGNYHLFLKVADDWLLFDGYSAFFKVGKLPKKELIGCAERTWIGGLKENELLEWLKLPRTIRTPSAT